MYWHFKMSSLVTAKCWMLEVWWILRCDAITTRHLTFWQWDVVLHRYWVNYSHSITAQRINIFLTQYQCQYICNDDILRSSLYPLKQHLHRLHNGARTKCGALTTVCHWKKHHDASNVISDDICVGPSNNQMRHNSALTTVIKKEVTYSRRSFQ